MATVSVLLPDGATRIYRNIPSHAALVARRHNLCPVGVCKYCSEVGYSYYKNYHVCPKCFLEYKSPHKTIGGIAEKYATAGSNKHRITGKHVDPVYQDPFKWNLRADPWRLSS